MTETEGVIKYNLDHHYSTLADTISINELNAWRTVLFKLELIGQSNDRYQGYGFGNISQRLSTDNGYFVITGTQTGQFKTLSRKYFCSIIEADPQTNHITSLGETKPSSEALTHQAVYQLNSKIQSVIHIHNPDIWNNTDKLDLPHTAKSIEYGTAEMAAEVQGLFQHTDSTSTGIFSMLGHEDGVIAFSDSIEKAAWLIIKYYSKAIALEPK